MKPQWKATLAVLAVVLPALFNFITAKVASDEAKIRAEVAYVTMQDVVKELQEASYTQALQIAKLEGQANCGALTPAPAPRPAVPAPKKVVPPPPPSVGVVTPPVKANELLMSLPMETNQTEGPLPPPPPTVVVLHPDGGEEELPPPQSQKVRPIRDFEQAVKEYKAKK